MQSISNTGMDIIMMNAAEEIVVGRACSIRDDFRTRRGRLQVQPLEQTMIRPGADNGDDNEDSTAASPAVLCDEEGALCEATNESPGPRMMMAAATRSSKPASSLQDVAHLVTLDPHPPALPDDFENNNIPLPCQAPSETRPLPPIPSSSNASNLLNTQAEYRRQYTDGLKNPVSSPTMGGDLNSTTLKNTKKIQNKDGLPTQNATAEAATGGRCLEEQAIQIALELSSDRDNLNNSILRSTTITTQLQEATVPEIFQDEQEQVTSSGGQFQTTVAVTEDQVMQVALELSREEQAQQAQQGTILTAEVVAVDATSPPPSPPPPPTTTTPSAVRQQVKTKRRRCQALLSSGSCWKGIRRLLFCNNNKKKKKRRRNAQHDEPGHSNQALVPPQQQQTDETSASSNSSTIPLLQSESTDHHRAIAVQEGSTSPTTDDPISAARYDPPSVPQVIAGATAAAQAASTAAMAAYEAARAASIAAETVATVAGVVPTQLSSQQPQRGGSSSHWPHPTLPAAAPHFWPYHPMMPPPVWVCATPPSPPSWPPSPFPAIPGTATPIYSEARTKDCSTTTGTSRSIGGGKWQTSHSPQASQKGKTTSKITVYPTKRDPGVETNKEQLVQFEEQAIVEALVLSLSLATADIEKIKRQNAICSTSKNQDCLVRLSNGGSSIVRQASHQGGTESPALAREAYCTMVQPEQEHTKEAGATIPAIETQSREPCKQAEGQQQKISLGTDHTNGSGNRKEESQPKRQLAGAGCMAPHSRIGTKGWRSVLRMVNSKDGFKEHLRLGRQKKEPDQLVDRCSVHSGLHSTASNQSSTLCTQGQTYQTSYQQRYAQYRKGQGANPQITYQQITTTAPLGDSTTPSPGLKGGHQVAAYLNQVQQQAHSTKLIKQQQRQQQEQDS